MLDRKYFHIALIILIDVDLFPINIENKEVGFKIKSSFRLIDATTIKSGNLTASNITKGDSLAAKDVNYRKSASTDMSLEKVRENRETSSNKDVSPDVKKDEGRKLKIVLHKPKSDPVVGETNSNEGTYEEETNSNEDSYEESNSNEDSYEESNSNEDSYEEETNSNEDSYEEEKSKFATRKKSTLEDDGHRSQDKKEGSFRMMSGNIDEVVGWYTLIVYILGWILFLNPRTITLFNLLET